MSIIPFRNRNIISRSSFKGGIKGRYIKYTSLTGIPALLNTTIATNGTTVTLIFSKNVTRGAGWANGDFDIDGTVSNNVLTYVSGDGTDTWTMTAASTVNNGESVNIDFNGNSNSVEDSNGNDLAAIVNGSVTNNSSQGAAGVTFIRAMNASAQAAADSISLNGLVVDGTNKLLVVGVTSYKSGGGNGVSTMNWNTSEAMTRLGSVLYWNTGEATELWYLINPTNANAGIGADLTVGTEASSMVAFLINGAHQSTPFGTPATDSTTSGTSVSANAASSTASLMIGILGYWADNTYTPGGSQIVPTNGESDGSGSESTIMSYKPGAATNTTLSWSWSGAQEAGLIVVAVNPP